MRIFITIPDGKIDVLKITSVESKSVLISFGRYEVLKVEKPFGRCDAWYVLKGTSKETFIGLSIHEWEKLQKRKMLSIQIERKKPSRICPHCEGTGFLKKKPRGKKE